MGESEFDTEKIRECLDKGEVISVARVSWLVEKSMEIFYHEENLIEIQSPVVICGDIHGQYEDLLELFRKAEGDTKNPKEHVPKTLERKYLFMGDYVDRGRFNLNTLLYLLTRKIDAPDKFFMLRGNHESRQVTRTYGFYAEIEANYGDVGIWNLCMSLFDLLPYAALIDGSVFSVHGGLSPQLNRLSFINRTDRQQEIPQVGLFADLTWSDPSPEIERWRQNTRGAGFLFGRLACQQFCYVNHIKLVTRSHQLAPDGYVLFFDDGHEPGGMLVNVWSAPNYCGNSGNLASVLMLNEPDSGNQYEFRQFDVAEHRLKDEDLACELNYFA